MKEGRKRRRRGGEERQEKRKEKRRGEEREKEGRKEGRERDRRRLEARKEWRRRDREKRGMVKGEEESMRQVEENIEESGRNDGENR